MRLTSINIYLFFSLVSLVWKESKTHASASVWTWHQPLSPSSPWEAEVALAGPAASSPLPSSSFSSSVLPPYSSSNFSSWCDTWPGLWADLLGFSELLHTQKHTQTQADHGYACTDTHRLLSFYHWNGRPIHTDGMDLYSYQKAVQKHQSCWLGVTCTGFNPVSCTDSRPRDQGPRLAQTFWMFGVPPKIDSCFNYCRWLKCLPSASMYRSHR